ncbi:YmfQ family protein [Paenibacillus psychroresistens]|nr:YmfQ family protein [Paenibacillus psychroresistens]
MSVFPVTSEKGLEMLSSLPAFYEIFREVRIINQIEGAELDDVFQSVDDVLNQVFIDTASWGLARWEFELGIPTNLSKPLEQRRSVVLSKRRGYGTVTVGLVKNVAEAYANGEVSVTEDNANYLVIIKFISTHGIPENLADIQNALRDLIPAHLAISYEFNYFIWNELDALSKSWDQTDAFGFTWDQWDIYS